MQTKRSFDMRRGLTLLELVMVVSILAILSALVVPGMTDQQENTRRTVARAALHEIRDAIANRYMQDKGSLPQPNMALDTSGRAATMNQQIDGTIPQLHFLFVNPNQYHAGSNPPYVAVNDYDAQAHIGWNGPYFTTKTATYPDPTEIRFPKDPNNTQTWAQDGFTNTYGQQGDFTINDPWGSPYVIHVRQSTHGGATVNSNYLVSAGPNRKLDIAAWTLNADGTINSGDDLHLLIKADK